MNRLIITNDISASGSLKMARRSNQVFALEQHLLEGPQPTNSELDYNFSSGSYIDTAYHRRVLGCRWAEDSEQKPSIKALCDPFDEIELWFDPTPEDQLALACLLQYLSNYPEFIERITLVYPECRLGEYSPEQVAALDPTRMSLDFEVFASASRIWTAWQSPSPADFFELLRFDGPGFPTLHDWALRLLDELPSTDTALGATEGIILEILSEGGASWMSVMTCYHQKRWPQTYRGFEAGQIMDDLCHCPVPVVLGLPSGPYDLALMDDHSRHTIYRGSTLALSPLGKALTAHRADFSQHNPVQRWWGNTKLTSENLWRWDSNSHALILPQ